MSGPKIVSVLETERFNVRGRSGEFRRFGYAVTRREQLTDLLLDLTVHSDAIIVVPVDAPGFDTQMLRSLSRSPASSRLVVGIPLDATDEELDTAVSVSSTRLIKTPVTPAALSVALAGMQPGGGPKTECEVLRIGRLTIDHCRHDVVVDGVSIVLGQHEFDVVAHIVESHPQVATHAGLWSAVGLDPAGNPEILRRAIFRIRNKIRRANPSTPELFESVSGIGYRLAETATATATGNATPVSPVTRRPIEPRTAKLKFMG